MCDLGMALGIASSVAGFAADSAKAKAENAARAKNRTAAVVDYNNQITNENHNFSQETKTTNSEGFDSTLAARAAIAKANAESASMGASGISVDAVFNELTAQKGRNEQRIKDKHDANKIDYTNRVTSHNTTATNRVHQNQPVAGPSPLGLIINVAGSMVK